MTPEPRYCATCEHSSAWHWVPGENGHSIISTGPCNDVSPDEMGLPVRCTCPDFQPKETKVIPIPPTKAPTTQDQVQTCDVRRVIGGSSEL